MKIKSVLFLLALGVMSASAASTTTYRVTAVVAGTANGVNNKGDVTGQLSSNGHAYLYKKGVITDLGAYSPPSLPEQLITVTGLAVNDSDVVVGLIAEGPVFLGDNREDAFLWKKGILIAIATGSSEGFSAAATAINNRGEAVGSCDGGETFNSDSHLGDAARAFLYRNNTLIDLGTLGGIHSEAGGINNAGAVVGIAETSDFEIFQAFLYQNGQMQAIGGALSSYFSPWAINDHGWITGLLAPEPIRFSGDNDTGPVTEPPGGGAGSTAVLYINGQITKLPSLPGFSGSEGLSINNSGVIVGNLFGPITDSSGFTREGVTGAFVYNGQMHNLNDLVGGGWKILSVGHISDTGQIAATGSLPGLTGTYGLLLTPIQSSNFVP